MIALVLFSLVSFVSSSSKTTNVWTSALYSATQDPTDNQVLHYGVTSSGTVSWIQSISTGYYGGPLSSQGSMVVVGDKLFVVNPNSDEVSMYGINTSNPASKAGLWLIDQDPSYGTYPTVLAGTSAYGGLLVNVNSMGDLYLSVFTWTDSILTRSTYVDLNITLNASQSFATSQVSFSPNNDYLVIEFKGLPNVAAIVFTIDSTGTFSAPMVYPPVAPLGPKSYGFNFVSDTWLVTTDPVQGILLYQIGSKGVVQSSTMNVTPASGAAALCWSTTNNLSMSFYGIAAGSGSIVEVSVTTSPWGLKQIGSPWTTTWKHLTDAVTVPLMDGAAGLFVLTASGGLGQWSIMGQGNWKPLPMIQYPTTVNQTNIGGLASYSMWSLQTTNSAHLVHPSLVLIALLLAFLSL